MNEKLTVVITAHARPSELARAFDSCLSAGANRVVVTATGISTEMKLVFSDLKRREPSITIIENPEGTCSNTAWLAGVRAAKTPYVLILHDDDMLLPGVMDRIMPHLNAGIPAIMWAAQFHDANAGITLNPIKAQGGVNKTRIILNFLQKQVRAISPGHGCYQKKDAEAALAEADQNLCGTEYRHRPDFVIGNDMLLWFRVAEYNPTFVYIEEPCVSFGCAKSVTHQTLKTGQDALMRYYDQTRDYWLTHPNRSRAFRITAEKPRCCVLCYLPGENYPGLEMFMRNLIENRPEYDTILYSDEVHRFIPKGTIRIPSCLPPNKKLQEGKAHDSVSAQAFTWGVRLALSYKFDYAIYLETDCRMTRPGWDGEIMREYFDWPTEAVCGGSPVCWHPWSWGEAWSRQLIQYAYEYQCRSGVMMAFEGDHTKEPCLYPNGALAVYDLPEIAYLFEKAIDNPSRYWPEVHLFDLSVGKALRTVYGSRCISKVAALTKAYSGCGGHHVSEPRRMQMLRNKEKVAIHQIKRTDI